MIKIISNLLVITFLVLISTSVHADEDAFPVGRTAAVSTSEANDPNGDGVVPSETQNQSGTMAEGSAASGQQVSSCIKCGKKKTLLSQAKDRAQSGVKQSPGTSPTGTGNSEN